MPAFSTKRNGPIVAACALAIVALAPFPSARASAFGVLHAFQGRPDGETSYSGLLIDKSGNLYGTTQIGGTTQGGTVFKVTPDGTETVLYSFTNGGNGGYFPDAGVIADSAGNFYGTTCCGGSSGDGVVYKLATDGKETALHSFAGGSDGSGPGGTLLMDAKGNLYGTTWAGGEGSLCVEGQDGCGTVFEVSSRGKEKVLYAFSGGSDGANPNAGLVTDKAGNLYGTTWWGGANGEGAVFRLSPDGTESVLYSFGASTNDAANPAATLLVDGGGNFYGTTDAGGTDNLGTVFKLAPAGTETVLHSFVGATDGSAPQSTLIMGHAGNLYGTTSFGGPHGGGTVFKLFPDGLLKVLHAFHGRSGSYPYAGVVQDRNGYLYGTTVFGGSCPAEKSGCGIVFKVRK